MKDNQQINLFDLMEDGPNTNQELSSEDKKIKELINRRRRQILVHSCLYYRMNTSLISDQAFDKWSYELVDLQRKHPEIAAQCIYAKTFETFDGSTGFDLPLENVKVVKTAEYLLLISKEDKNIEK